MLRRAVIAVFLCTLGLCLGCDGDSKKPSNPNNLEYGKDGPPKRDSIKEEKK